jgi:hypothetical protein
MMDGMFECLNNLSFEAFLPRTICRKVAATMARFLLL